jgi:hypothetical protein
MIEIINYIGNITFPGNYKPQQSFPVKRNGSSEKSDLSITTSKYILENNNIVLKDMTATGN